VSVRSMTGFARVRKAHAEAEIAVGIKSVNHRGLDLQVHLPPEMEPLESEIRGALKQALARGHVQVNITIARASAGGAGALNRPLFDAYLRAFREAAEILDIQARPDPNAALQMPGMLGSGDWDELGALSDDAAKATLEAVREAVAALNQFREREGAAMAVEIRQRCDAVCGLARRMEEIRAGATPAFQRRLREKLAELLEGAGIEPQRLAQEAALLADRSDIAEELLRLRTHAGQVDQMMEAGGEVGKRLDFLLQEMNREANTILSKTGGLGDLGLTMTDLALAAKSEIDKIREQSLNLE
jgi:uncharacterized protein (TIGR00255 family)